MRKKIILIVGIIILNIATFVFTGGSFYKNVTEEHTIYSKVEEGINYDEFLQLLDNNKIGYTIKNNELKTKRLLFNVANQEKVEVMELSRLVEYFKGIDERQDGAIVKVSYGKDGKKSETIDYYPMTYKNGEYLELKIYLPFMLVVSVFVSITILLFGREESKNKKKKKKRVNNENKEESISDF